MARLVRRDGSHALLLNSIDVTERNRAARALQESEGRWRAILENAPDTILVMDLDGRLTFVNHALPQLQAGEVLGRSVYDLVPPSFRPTLRGVLDRVVQTGRRETYEVNGLGPAGLSACFQNSVGALTAHGKVESLIVISADITDRKLAETALKDSEQRFRLVFEDGPVGMAVVAPDLSFQRVNRAFCRMLDYDPQECARLTLTDTFPTRDRAVYAQLARRLFAGELDHLDLERPIVAPGGRQLWGHVSASVVRDENGRALYGIWIVENIDERRRAEQALRRSAAQLEEAQRIAHVGSWSWHFGTRTFDCTDELLRIYGVARADLPDPPWRALLDMVHPDDRGKVEQLRRKTLREHQPYDFEHRIRRPTGEVRVLRSRGTLEFAPTGEAQRVYGTVEDVTDARRADAERTRLFQQAQE
ncbi:MAG: PAS domain S-box protein, partial [Myxococcales bacterium]